MPIKRITISLLAVLGVLAPIAPAQASDKTLEKALKPYKTKLTHDVAYLAGFKAPSKSKAASALKELSTIHGDLSGANKAAKDNQASSTNGKTGRADVLTGLKYALSGAADAEKSAKAAKSGKSSTAKSDAKSDIALIKKAIPPLEAGGSKLGLF
jgi:hypothetical protein